jgi:hypothetical protein
MAVSFYTVANLYNKTQLERKLPLHPSIFKMPPATVSAQPCLFLLNTYLC